MSYDNHRLGSHPGCTPLNEQHQWVMRLVLDGYSVQEIAHEMRLPVDIVETLLAETIRHARDQIR